MPSNVAETVYNLLSELRQSVDPDTIDADLLQRVDGLLEFVPVVSVGVSYRVNSEDKDAIHVTAHRYAEVDVEKLEDMAAGNAAAMFNVTTSTFEALSELVENAKESLVLAAARAQVQYSLMPDNDDTDEESEYEV